MSGTVTTKNGAYFRFEGTREAADAEYERFQGCLLQLIDDNSIVGNLEGRWVIFQNGWVYGLSSYPCEGDAAAFGRQIFRDEPDANYIIAECEPEKHALSAMHLLASALSDVESYQMREAAKGRKAPTDDE